MTIERAAAIPVGPGPHEPTPAIWLGSARRPEAAHVRLDGWEGPLGLLLALIESRQLDVLSVPLGSLADAYLDALAGLEDDRIGHVSAFVAVASQLILIKSRALLPRRPETAVSSIADEGVDPEAELRARLLRYRVYRDAGQRLAATALERVGLFHRDPSVARAAGVSGAMAPEGPPLDPGALVVALDGLLRIVPPPAPPPEAIRRVLTLAEVAERIRAALRLADVVVLQELLRGERDRVVVTVTFLAMLELVKRREIVVEQAGPWAPIVARATAPGERLASGVPIDVVAEPIDESLGSFA